MLKHPPTIFVVHPKERPSKCSVEPLRGRDEFVFVRYGTDNLPDLSNYVRLGLGGPILSGADADKGLLVLDGTWHLAGKMDRDFADVTLRSLPPWRTAYPRVSKLRQDPPEGLATIEALYAAFTILGRATNGLLDDYHWADEFLGLNKEHLSP